LFILKSKMRGAVFVFIAAVIVGAQAGCEWYKNCGACVADSGCGWCSNDPTGVGSGSIDSHTTNSGKDFMSTLDSGTAGDVGGGGRSDTRDQHGVVGDWLVNVRGQYEQITGAAQGPPSVGTLAQHLDFEGTGYVASPYFGQTWGGADRKKHLIGLHKTKFTTELKASYTVTPYTKGTYTVSSVQSDTQATMKSPWTSTFDNIEFQIGNIPASGTISYPDTSKEDVYGSWPPNPTKFTTELKDGYTVACKESAACGGVNVRITKVYNDQHLSVSPRFTRSFAEKSFVIEMGPRGVGLISGTATASSLQGSDPCRTHGSPPEPCYENTRFLTELRVDDRIHINSNQTGTLQERTVAAIQDNAHLTLTTTLSSMLNTKSKFKIKSFHSSPFTYARKATGGLSFAGGTSHKIVGYNSTTFTKNLMAGYAIIAPVPGVGWEKRTVVSIDSQTSLTIDSPFSAAFARTGAGATSYNYESCPSLTYENFDLRTENGHGVITSDGTNHVYDNVQYSKITTTGEDPSTPAGQGGPKYHDKAAKFVRHLKVGYTITMDGITRTVTKIVSNTLLHVDRAFKEGVEHKDYSYRYSVRKTGDFHLHWKPSSLNGDYHQTSVVTDAGFFSRGLIANPTLPAGHDTGPVLKQKKYLQYPPVCYNTGRCVPKSSHSLVGVESKTENVQVLSSTLPHQTDVLNYVKVADSSAYFSSCKPVCTITVASKTAAGDLATATWETRRVITKVNTTFIQTELAFSKIPKAAGATQYQGRVRYVTGTGTVRAESGNTVTGASKETKTKFNSEFSSGWTITIGCGGATCQGTSCATDADCMIAGKVTGGKCLGTPKVCTAESKNITAVSSDTQLTTSAAFVNSYTKVDYTIGQIPGLGYITNSQNSKIIDGTTGTRFLEQLKVGYTITSMTQTRTITAIASNKLMTVNTAFDNPGITTITSFKFSGKKGTGEVTVNHATQPKVVIGTNDVTQTQFQNELALGYMFMLGNDYKVVTKIVSNTILEVDTPFTKATNVAYGSVAKWGNDYNYESCWLSMGGEAAVKGSHSTAGYDGIGWPASPTGVQSAAYKGDSYTNKKVYVEDACEIKPGCCGFKISSVVYPDRFAYYKIRPPHTNMNIRVVVKTTEDNVDLVVKKNAVPTTASYDYKSVRESNPWALTVPQDKITCGQFAGINYKHVPSNCDYWYIGVRGDNRYPQKTGASEYDLYVYTEFDFPNFLCSDAHTQIGVAALAPETSVHATDRCKWLGVMKNEDANMVTNDDSQAVMRLTPNVNQVKGSMYYSTKVHLYDGFETTFQFRMTGFSVGCNSVLYPSGFCGGGDGFSFVIQKTDDKQIGCVGSGLGYANVMASKQGNDWARHRCTTVSGSPANQCDQNDDGIFNEACVVGALCKHIGAQDTTNGGCGVTGKCGFMDCQTGIQMVLAVEFDTWNNLKLHDPKQGVSRWWINATEFVGYNDNHVAIFSSNGKMESDHALNAHFAATPSIPNLADGKNHTVKIKYWPTLIDFGKELDGFYNRTNLKKRGHPHTSALATTGDCEDTNTPTKYPAPDDCYRSELRNNKPGNFAVFIDDMKRPVLQTAISLRKSLGYDSKPCYDNDRDRCVLDEIGNAYIGFTAATGGERAQGRAANGNHQKYVASQSGSAAENAKKMLGAAQNHEILNWKFCNQIGCVPI
jgi:hypothetical protein